MGMVIEGKWIDDDAKYRNPTGGAFVRPESKFRDTVTADGASGFKAEPGRYHLFLAPNCPWAHRTLIMRNLKGLEGLIDLSVTHWDSAGTGWTFRDGPGVVADPVLVT